MTKEKGFWQINILGINIQVFLVEKDKSFFQVHLRDTTPYANLDEGYEFYLSTNLYPEKVKAVILQNSCRNVYLPQRFYAMGEEGQELIADWMWDNINRHIFIDRFMVTGLDLELYNQVHEPKIPTFGELSEIASGLSFSEMKKYCASRGASVLTAYMYDAATFVPANLEETKVKRIKRAFYPESRRTSDGVLFKIQQEKREILPEECKRYYIRGCQEYFPYQNHNNNLVSWMGIAEVLTGPMEFLEDIVTNKNVKASSFYLDVYSNWHRLGRRATWNMDSFDGRSFDIDEISLMSNVKMGFRCFVEKDALDYL